LTNAGSSIWHITQRRVINERSSSLYRKSSSTTHLFSTARRSTYFNRMRMSTKPPKSHNDPPEPKGCSTSNMTEKEQREAFLLTGSRLIEPETKLDIEERISKIFEQVDTNNNGVLCKEEFVSWYMSVYDAAKDSPAHKLPVEDAPDPPTSAQLNAYSLRVMLPFFAFGFIDNSLMIMFGECIDIALSQKLACSMMISAGLGNTISDAIGVLGSDSIDRVAGRIDDAMGTALRTPTMTQKQLKLTIVKRRKTIFQAVGIVAGCLVGMFPLIFI